MRGATDCTAQTRTSTGGSSKRASYREYDPIFTPKNVAANVWIVDGPVIDYRVASLRIPCPTRMTIIRLRTGALWLHSPVRYDSALAEAISRLGNIAFLIAPNTLHHEYVDAWKAAFPNAAVLVPAPLLSRFEKYRPAILSDEPPDACRGEIEQSVVEAPRFTEVMFFHTASSTLVVTDLMQNFEADRFSNPLIARAMKWSGATGPDYSPSIDLRHWFRHHHDRIFDALKTIREWRPERVILSHGRIILGVTPSQIEQAFAWATPKSWRNLRLFGVIFAVLLIAGELWRSWRIERPLPLILDDICMGGFLLVSSCSAHLLGNRARALLSAAWAMLAGMLYMSFFGKIYAPDSVESGNWSIAALTILVGVAWLTSLVGLISSLAIRGANEGESAK